MPSVFTHVQSFFFFFFFFFFIKVCLVVVWLCLLLRLHPCLLSRTEKKFFRIGEKKPICVVPDIFASEIRINIREYYTPRKKDLLSSSESDSEDRDQSFLYPTKKGVSLTLGEFLRHCAQTLKTSKCKYPDFFYLIQLFIDVCGSSRRTLLSQKLER